jgi:hypothetical protein
MNQGTPPLSARKKKPDKATLTLILTSVLTTMPSPPVPTQGGLRAIHGVFVGRNDLQDEWTSAGRYCYTSQRQGDKHVAKEEQNLVTTRDSVSILKFHGTLELTGATVTELDKDQFVWSVEQGVREHGHQTLYVIPRGTRVMDLLEPSSILGEWCTDDY